MEGSDLKPSVCTLIIRFGLELFIPFFIYPISYSIRIMDSDSGIFILSRIFLDDY